MKRGLVFSLCAAAALASAQLASAQNSVVVSLDIYYSNAPLSSAGGGTWQLLAKVTAGGAQGLAGLDTALTGTTGTPVFLAPTPAFKTNFDAKTWLQDQDGNPATLDMLFGQVPVAAPGPQDLLYGVGLTTVNPDELRASVDTSGVDMTNAITLAVGQFSAGATPAFVAGGTAANVFTAQGVGGAPPAVGSIVAATITTQVRNNLTSKAGDATLDKAVTAGDVTRVLGNFSPGTKLWQQGDVTGDMAVTAGDVTRILGNFGSVAAASSIPEPTGAALAMLALAGLARLRKRA